jgi:hypothetical protein
MAKIEGLHFLSFSSYWENSHMHRLWIGISCSAPTMGLLSTLEVKVLHRKVALHPGAARRGIGRKRVLYKSEKILHNFWKIRTFSAFFKKMGGEGGGRNLTHSVFTCLWISVYIMESLLALALPGTKCIKNRQTFFFLYRNRFTFNLNKRLRNLIIAQLNISQYETTWQK